LSPQGMSLGVGIAGTAVSAISFLTLAAVSRQEVAPSPAEVAPAAFAYFTGAIRHSQNRDSGLLLDLYALQVPGVVCDKMCVLAGSAMIVVLAIVTYFVFFMLPYVHSHSIPEGAVLFSMIEYLACDKIHRLKPTEEE